MHPIPRKRRPAAGFTLIEVVLVMVITAIISAVVAVFIVNPVAGVMEATHRAALADTADTALRRMRRDIQAALPNSVRVSQSGSVWWIEFLPVLAAGRYCITSDCGSYPLDLVAGNTSLSFASLQPSLSPIPANTEVAIYNLGVSGSDAYAGSNTVALSAIATSSLTFATNKVFPFESPGMRFHIIGSPVSYACNLNGGLRRYWGYSKQASQPTAAPSGASSALLANNVSACSLNYQQAVLDQNGLLYVTLQLSLNNENVNLTHAIQISNVP